MSWHEYLRPSEMERIAEIEAERVALQREYRKIMDRCRKRGERKTPTPVEPEEETRA